MTSARCAPRSPWRANDKRRSSSRVAGPRLHRRRAGTCTSSAPGLSMAPGYQGWIFRPRPAAKPTSSAPTRRPASVCRMLKPFQPSLMTPSEAAACCAAIAKHGRRHRDAVERALADDEHRLFRLGRRVIEALEMLRQALGAGAEIGVGIGEIGLLADHADRSGIALEEALADARIQHRRFLARIGADQHDRVGLFDAGNGRVEQIAGAAEFRMSAAEPVIASWRQSMFLTPSAPRRSA